MKWNISEDDIEIKTFLCEHRKITFSGEREQKKLILLDGIVQNLSIGKRNRTNVTTYASYVAHVIGKESKELDSDTKF